MAIKTYREAITEALMIEMDRDERVIVMGEDVAGGAGGSGVAGMPVGGWALPGADGGGAESPQPSSEAETRTRASWRRFMPRTLPALGRYRRVVDYSQSSHAISSA